MFNRVNRRWPLQLIFALSLTLVTACGEDPEPEADRYPSLSQADPLALTQAEVGVGVRHGESLVFARNFPMSYKSATERWDHIMLRVRSYDELAQSFGEYTYQKAPNDLSSRSPALFLDTPALGNVDRRTEDLVKEIDAALGDAQSQGFSTRSVVIDYWRTRLDWYVRWDGLLQEDVNRIGKGDYGFGRQAMYDTQVERAVNVARDLKPKYMILGDEMDLLLATDKGAGLSIGEFSSFLSFYQEAAQKIREASPETKVGVGINWDRFATRVALSYTDKESVEQLTDEDLDYAFSVVILPLLAHSDILALKSYREPAESVSYYQFLRRLPALYDINPKIVWYSVGSPITSNAGAVRQRNYFNDFLKWNGGVNVEAVFWERFLNIDGTDTASQNITGRCLALTEATRDFQTPLSRCYDGLFDSLYQPRPIHQGILDTLN